MKYFLDTEFLEGPQDKRFFGIKIGQTKPTIDLISIGMVSENNREYYAVSKDFNLREAWNRFQIETQSGDMRNMFPNGKKVYWLRENVLKPIYQELLSLEDFRVFNAQPVFTNKRYKREFSLKTMDYLLKVHGKTNKEIAIDIQKFVVGDYNATDLSGKSFYQAVSTKNNPPEFYAYYADYDWVVFCWLFGKMIDLPKGFPMYCNDLKQILDEKDSLNKRNNSSSANVSLKYYNSYPKKDNLKSHNAIEDARWNKKLFDFLKEL